jgi:hypothetical protein
VSPLWRPTPSVDRELAKSKQLRQELTAAVQELDRFVTRLNQETEQLEHDQEAGESE